MTASGPLTLEIEGPTALLTLNDPGKRNALTSELATALLGACETVRHDHDVRCVVVTGAGQAFSAGGDVRRMADGANSRSPAQMVDESSDDSYTALARATIKALIHLEKPVIAALNGPALGWGTDIALACDIRLATPRTKMGETFVRVGAVSGTGGIYLLPRIIGLGRAAELLLTGRTVDADEALGLGMVNAVVEEEELLPRARAIAEEIALAAPLAVQLTKRALYSAANWSGSIEQAIDQAMYFNHICMNSHDHREAARALIERRRPDYERG